MNIKLLIISLSIIIFSNLLVMLSILKMHLPYTIAMFTFTLLSLLLWFFLLKKDVPLSIKNIDHGTFKASLLLIIITSSLSVFMIATSEVVNYDHIVLMLITAVLVAVYEEIIFRGIGLGSFLSSGISPLRAILLSSVIFSLFHIGYVASIGLDIILLFMNTFMMGFILGTIYYKTKNILLIIVIHFLWDFAVFINQKLPTVEIGTVTAIILFVTTILYFTWSVKKVRLSSHLVN